MAHLLKTSKSIYDPIETPSKLEIRRQTGAVAYATQKSCGQRAPGEGHPSLTGAQREGRTPVCLLCR